MLKHAVLWLCVMAWLPLAWAGTNELILSEPDVRITDAIVNDDLQMMHEVQKELDHVDVSHIPNGVYHHAKAQALLDFTWDEYHENDRTGAVEAAFSYVQALIEALQEGKSDINLEPRLLPGTRVVDQKLWDEARKEYHDNDHTGTVKNSSSHVQALIEALQQGQSDISLKTRLLPGTRIVDQELWNQAAAMKRDKNFHCAQEPIAGLEVQLLWMGHEYDELGWRHTKDQQKTARDLLKQAKDALANCNKPAPVIKPACIPASQICEQAAPPTPILPAFKKPVIPSHRTIVYFDLDKHNLKAKGPGTLNAALNFIRTYPNTYRIRIEAHTDRLASTAYNKQLSQQRAKQVRDYLVDHQVNADILELDWFGETRPVVYCKDKDYKTHKALAACLQVNRRAEVFLFTPDQQ